METYIFLLANVLLWSENSLICSFLKNLDPGPEGHQIWIQIKTLSTHLVFPVPYAQC